MLHNAGWRNVSHSDYGPEAKLQWKARPKSDWQRDYNMVVAQAKWFRRTPVEKAGIAVIGETLGNFQKSLEEKADAMIRMTSSKPPTLPKAMSGPDNPDDG
jgi:hypothetical protein